MSPKEENDARTMSSETETAAESERGRENGEAGTSEKEAKVDASLMEVMEREAPEGL